MKNDELLHKGEIIGHDQLDMLDNVLERVVENLETGRNDIFNISQECHRQCENLQTELMGLERDEAQVLAELDRTEKEERMARLHLRDISNNFYSYSEEQIKQAYEKDQMLQVIVLEYRERLIYTKRHQEQLQKHIEQMASIYKRADRILTHTTLALKILSGNADKINSAIDEINRKQNIEMWIIESQEAERRKIARDLHDGPAQSLASMLIRLDLVERLPATQYDTFREELEKTKLMGQECLADIRRLMFDLKPTLIHEEGFLVTLKDYFNRYEAKYDFEIDLAVHGRIRKYELYLEIALFRLVQEAITNVRKHSGVQRVGVKIEDTGKFLTIIIKDEGSGFDFARIQAESESYGIMGMKERVELFGGSIDIISSPGAGTQVVIRVPLEREAIYERHKGANSG